MSISLDVTPNITFSSEKVDIAKLNMMATPLVTLAENSITLADCTPTDDNAWGPFKTTFETDATNEWSFRDTFSVQFGYIAGSTSTNTVITFPIGSLGGAFCILPIYQSATSTVTFELTGIYSTLGGGTFGPVTAGFYVTRFLYLWPTSQSAYMVHSARCVQ